MPLKRTKEKITGNFVPNSINLEARTVDVTWSMGGKVLRRDPEYGLFYEEISLEPNHVRMGRLENGAPVLNNHNDKKLFDQIGVVERAWIKDGVGGATLKFSKRVDVDPIFEDVSEGIFRNVSVGYKPYKAIEIEQENDHPILRSVDTEFFEISLVPINAEAGAQVRAEAETYSQEIITRSEDMPMPKKKTGEDKSKEGTFKQGEPDKKTEPKNTPPETDKDSRSTRALPNDKVTEIVSQERLRIRAIEDRCETHSMSAEFTRKLIDDGLTEIQANQAILDELTKRSLDNMVQNQGRTPNIQAGDFDEMETRRDAVKNGLLFGFDRKLVRNEELNEKVRTLSKRSIPQIIGMELERKGERVAHLSEEELVKRSFHSTSDFPIIMGLAGEAAIKQSYLNLVKTQTFRPLVRYESAKNFLPMRKLQMGEIPSLERIPEGAEVTYGSISENAEQWAIGKYGKAFAATYEMMVNDQRNLVFGGMTAYGAAAARMESNLVWGVFKENPMCYKMNAKRENVADANWFDLDKHHNISGPSALTHDAIEEAEYMMSIQKGNDKHEGDELNIEPRFLIVPSRLKNTAKRLLYSQYNPTQVQDVNIYQNAFDVISEARLNPKGKDDPYSWYMTCDPNVLPVLWMAYLNGEQEPRTMYQTDFDTLSIKIRADLNFGVTHGEWRAVHMNAGVSLEEQKEANKFIVPQGLDRTAEGA